MHAVIEFLVGLFEEIFEKLVENIAHLFHKIFGSHNHK